MCTLTVVMFSLWACLCHFLEEQPIPTVDCVVCHKKMYCVSSLYEAIIITDVDCVVCKYNDNYASSLVAAIYVAVIPNIYNSL